MNSRRPVYYFRTSVGANGATVQIAVSNIIFGSVSAQKFAIIQSLFWFAFYDLSASPGVFSVAPGSIALGGSAGSRASYLKSGNSMAVADIQFADRVYHHNLSILTGQLGPTDTLPLVPTYYTGVAAASINSFTGQVVLGVEFWDLKSVKANFDV